MGAGPVRRKRREKRRQGIFSILHLVEFCCQASGLSSGTKQMATHYIVLPAPKREEFISEVGAANVICRTHGGRRPLSDFEESAIRCLWKIERMFRDWHGRS